MFTFALRANWGQNMKYLVLAVLVVTSAVAAARVDRPAQGVVVTVNRTPANDGKLMYASYCASCHGLDGKGDGPTASALISRPTDLTALSRNNHGKFPLVTVKSALEFARRAQYMEPSKCRHGDRFFTRWTALMRASSGECSGLSPCVGTSSQFRRSNGALA
jgi:Cytochrome c